MGGGGLDPTTCQLDGAEAARVWGGQPSSPPPPPPLSRHVGGMGESPCSPACPEP